MALTSQKKDLPFFKRSTINACELFQQATIEVIADRGECIIVEDVPPIYQKVAISTESDAYIYLLERASEIERGRKIHSMRKATVSDPLRVHVKTLHHLDPLERLALNVMVREGRAVIEDDVTTIQEAPGAGQQPTKTATRGASSSKKTGASLKRKLEKYPKVNS